MQEHEEVPWLTGGPVALRWKQQLSPGFVHPQPTGVKQLSGLKITLRSYQDSLNHPHQQRPPDLPPHRDTHTSHPLPNSIPSPGALIEMGEACLSLIPK